jgi:hypothetical protein
LVGAGSAFFVGYGHDAGGGGVVVVGSFSSSSSSWGVVVGVVVVRGFLFEVVMEMMLLMMMRLGKFGLGVLLLLHLVIMLRGFCTPSRQREQPQQQRVWYTRKFGRVVGAVTRAGHTTRRRESTCVVLLFLGEDEGVVVVGVKGGTGGLT